MRTHGTLTKWNDDRGFGFITPAQVSASDTSMQLASPSSRYSCDGRRMCSQMTSCAEATYFIRNCPNTKMDGDGDGVPCESQWCN
jgi:hypothetical protein